MAKQELRDSSGRLIGTIDMSGSKHEGRDASGRLKGSYDPKSNETRDSSGRLVGKGNLLSSLITQL
jgi:YD repeat-containing protein